MYVYACVYVCVNACMYVCIYVRMYVYVYAVCVSNYISPHFLSCVLYKRKYCEFKAGIIWTMSWSAMCSDLCLFSWSFLRVFVTNKDKVVYISLLIFIAALLSDPQDGQLYFIPGTGRNFSYHHLVQTDTEIQPGSYQRGAKGSFQRGQTSSVKLSLTFMSYKILKCVDHYLHIHF